eukprot:m.309063 g.309063  ORF g.309063 m.309063 type:complete len:417 (+) comp45414_c0_seq1:98-1348(+)
MWKQAVAGIERKKAYRDFVVLTVCIIWLSFPSSYGHGYQHSLMDDRGNFVVGAFVVPSSGKNALENRTEIDVDILLYENKSTSGSPTSAGKVVVHLDLTDKTTSLNLSQHSARIWHRVSNGFTSVNISMSSIPQLLTFKGFLPLNANKTESPLTAVSLKFLPSGSHYESTEMKPTAPMPSPKVCGKETQTTAFPIVFIAAVTMLSVVAVASLIACVVFFFKLRAAKNAKRSASVENLAPTPLPPDVKPFIPTGPPMSGSLHDVVNSVENSSTNGVCPRNGTRIYNTPLSYPDKCRSMPDLLAAKKPKVAPKPKLAKTSKKASSKSIPPLYDDIVMASQSLNCLTPDGYLKPVENCVPSSPEKARSYDNGRSRCESDENEDEYVQMARGGVSVPAPAASTLPTLTDPDGYVNVKRAT